MTCALNGTELVIQDPQGKRFRTVHELADERDQLEHGRHDAWVALRPIGRSPHLLQLEGDRVADQPVQTPRE